jgi:hypothetical protein
LSHAGAEVAGAGSRPDYAAIANAQCGSFWRRRGTLVSNATVAGKGADGAQRRGTGSGGAVGRRSPKRLNNRARFVISKRALSPCGCLA